mmetsp:Transcript_11827/g.36067  ORF Transcript_11827/g.36067 Transcript_11827/m.36067 type:complete len:156 (+) Transcript_11827:43-510(+)
MLHFAVLKQVWQEINCEREKHMRGFVKALNSPSYLAAPAGDSGAHNHIELSLSIATNPHDVFLFGFFRVQEFFKFEGQCCLANNIVGGEFVNVAETSSDIDFSISRWVIELDGRRGEEYHVSGVVIAEAVIFRHWNGCPSTSIPEAKVSDRCPGR